MNNKKESISIVSIIIVVIVIGLVVYFLLNTKKETDQKVLLQENQISDTTSTTNNEIMPQTNTMEKISKPGDVLVMNYTGRLIDGTVFDSNVDPKFNHVEPFKFTLGAGQVIKGWDEGLVGMKIGEKKTLTIPPEKAYGDRAVSIIPSNSTLIFDVELVGIE